VLPETPPEFEPLPVALPALELEPAAGFEVPADGLAAEAEPEAEAVEVPTRALPAKAGEEFL
jgi:hypothetical protein